MKNIKNNEILLVLLQPLRRLSAIISTLSLALWGAILISSKILSLFMPNLVVDLLVEILLLITLSSITINFSIYIFARIIKRNDNFSNYRLCAKLVTKIRQAFLEPVESLGEGEISSIKRNQTIAYNSTVKKIRFIAYDTSLYCYFPIPIHNNDKQVIKQTLPEIREWITEHLEDYRFANFERSGNYYLLVGIKLE